MSELVVDSDYESLRAIGPWLGGVLETLDETARMVLLQRIELAVQELATNSIDHAKSGEAGITLRADIVGDSVVVELSDRGVAVDLDAIPEPDHDEPQVRGYGMMIVDQLADELGYERIAQRNVWTVRFDLPTTSPRPEPSRDSMDTNSQQIDGPQDGDSDVVVVGLTGNLDAFAATDVRARLTEHVDGGHTRLVIDLSEVESVDSAGLAALVQALKRCRQADGDVRLVRPAQAAANRVFELTKFDLVFTMADRVEELTDGW